MNPPPLRSWVSRAACAGSGPELFFPNPDDAEATRTAKAVCGSCPVLLACRAYGLSRPAERGIWGGLTETERRRIRRHPAGRTA